MKCRQDLNIFLLLFSNLFYQINNKTLPENASEFTKKKAQVNEEDEKQKKNSKKIDLVQQTDAPQNSRVKNNQKKV